MSYCLGFSGENIISTACLQICAGLLLGPESVFLFVDLVSPNFLKIHCTSIVKLTVTAIFLLHLCESSMRALPASVRKIPVFTAPSTGLAHRCSINRCSVCICEMNA